jgi:hypothetical protein
MPLQVKHATVATTPDDGISEVGTNEWNAAHTVLEVVTALSISSGVVAIDLSLGNYFTLTLDANVTSITLSNAPASGFAQSIAIRFLQDGTGGRTVALPSSFKPTGGSDTAVASAASSYTMLVASTFDQGTRWEYTMQECG